MHIRAAEKGDLREDDKFAFEHKPTNQAPSTFTAVTGDEVIVTRRFSNLANLPDETAVIAHWHGKHRTDGFLTTVGKLKRLAAEFAD